MKFPLVDIHEAENTKDRILLTAVQLFSERGYAAVSIRDITERLQIRPSSMYNHFESKEALFNAIIDTIKNVYLDYFDRLDKALEKASCFEEALECLFAELKEVYHMFVYYGISMIATEQFRNEKARRAFNDIYMKIGIDYSAKIFNDCIEKKWVEDFDTRTLATLFMNSVFAGSLIRTQQDLKHETVYDATEMFSSLQGYILNSVKIIPS